MNNVKLKTFSLILAIIISLGTIASVYVTLNDRVVILEESQKNQIETTDEKFIRLDKVVTDNTNVIKDVQITMTKLNTTLDLIMKLHIVSQDGTKVSITK